MTNLFHLASVAVRSAEVAFLELLFRLFNRVNDTPDLAKLPYATNTVAESSTEGLQMQRCSPFVLFLYGDTDVVVLEKLEFTRIMLC